MSLNGQDELITLTLDDLPTPLKHLDQKTDELSAGPCNRILELKP